MIILIWGPLNIIIDFKLASTIILNEFAALCKPNPSYLLKSSLQYTTFQAPETLVFLTGQNVAKDPTKLHTLA